MSDDSYGSRSPDSEPEPDRAFIRIDPENVFYLARLSASPLPPEFPSDVHAADTLATGRSRGHASDVAHPVTTIPGARGGKGFSVASWRCSDEPFLYHSSVLLSARGFAEGRRGRIPREKAGGAST